MTDSTLTTLSIIRIKTGVNVVRLQRLCDENGIATTRRRATNGKMAVCIDSANVDKLIGIARPGFDMSAPVAVAEPDEMPTTGNCVYVVQLDPVTRPGRVKLGTTDNVALRMLSFKTVCPESTLHSQFKVDRQCEGYVLSIANVIGTRVGQEVFDFTPEQFELFISTITIAFKPLIDNS